MDRKIKVLLVEDSIADATLIQEILRDEKIDVELNVVRDGFDLSKFTQLVKYIENFWFTSVQYPTAIDAQ